MQSKMIIGLTGGIGSGKSYIGHIFKLLGADLYDADTEAKKVMLNDLTLVNGIKKEFGEHAYTASGELNRTYLAEAIFSDATLRAKLNSLVHPATLNHFKEFVEASRSDIVVIEAAILIESGFHKYVDIVVTVEADIDLRVRRTVERDGGDEGLVYNRMAAQMSDAQRREYAHYVIRNSGKELLLTQIVSILEKRLFCS